MEVGEIQDLKLYLKEFRELTIKLIDLLESNNFEKLEEVLFSRDEIICKINQLKSNSEIFKELSENINLLPLQQKLTILMNKKRADLRNKLINLEDNKTASKNYSKKFSIDSLYFNKKI